MRFFTVPSQDIMHRCLLINELVARIAQACVPDILNASTADDRKPDRRTVYALARTCRAFHEPALDVIWSYQYGLDHLLACMPDDLWEEFWEEPTDGPVKYDPYRQLVRVSTCVVHRLLICISTTSETQTDRVTGRLGSLPLLRAPCADT